MKYISILFGFLLLSFTPLTFANAEVFQERIEGTLDVYTNQLVFSPGEPIFVHGKTAEKEATDSADTEPETGPKNPE